MKKTIFFLLALFLLAPSVSAASIVSNYSSKIDQNETKQIATIAITSNEEGDITAEHGIRLFIDQYQEILWDDALPMFYGTAVVNGRVAEDAQVEFADDYKSIFIPVQEDFQLGEVLNISGLKLRAYDDPFGNRRIGLDIDGDMVVDIDDLSSYEVTANVVNDHTPTYPVKNLTYELHEDGSLTLNWDLPVDYDYHVTHINRTSYTNGNPKLSTVYSGYFGIYTDYNLEGVEKVSYSLVATDDEGNWGDPVVLEIDLTAPQEVPQQPEEPQVPEEPQQPQEPVNDNVSQEELDQLNQFLNYYKLRYEIACFEAGQPLVNMTQLCLWNKVDLVYAQEMTGNEVVAGLALSEDDLYLMGLVKNVPVNRYNYYCEGVENQPDYCPALAKRIQRSEHYLN